MSTPGRWPEPNRSSAREGVWKYAPTTVVVVTPEETKPAVDLKAPESEDRGLVHFWASVNNALSSEGELVMLRLPHRRTWSELRTIFDELASRWRRETAMEALPSRRAMNFSYQSIIGMGPDALPFILESLGDEVDDWFWALTAITRENVAAGTTTMYEAAAAWLDWGKAERYVV